MSAVLNSDRRRSLRWFAAGSAALFSSLLPKVSQAQPSGPVRGGPQAWEKAKEAINEARAMAERVSSSVSALGQQTQSALALRDRLDKSLAELKREIAEMIDRRDREMEDYRQGLFCSGCNRTRTDILSKGEQFPHRGQSIVRPTPEQIAAKEKALQQPIDRSQAQQEKEQKQRIDADADAQNGLRQLRAGLLLWRTSTTYWSRAVQRDLHYHREELQANVAELERTLADELRRMATLAPAERKEAEDAANVWRRQLEQQRAALDALAQSASGSLQAVSSAREQQRQLLLRRLTPDPLGKQITAAHVHDGPIMSGEGPLGMGVDYLMGRVPKAGETYQWLPNVSAFVQDYRSFGALHINAMGYSESTPGPGLGTATAGPPAPSRNPLLQALP